METALDRCNKGKLPVVSDGIKGGCVRSVLCFGMAVVNGATVILTTAGRSKLCKRIFPVRRGEMII